MTVELNDRLQRIYENKKTDGQLSRSRDLINKLEQNLVEEYINFITNVFKRNSVKVLSIRKHGATCLNNLS